MKRLTAPLVLLICLSLSCSKAGEPLNEEPTMTLSTHDDPDPNDNDCCPPEDGGDGPAVSGSSTCSSAWYSVSHRGGQLRYNISFNIVSGAIQNLNFNTTLYTPTPTLETLTLLGKAATYNPGSGIVTVTIYYKLVIKDFATNYTYTQYVNVLDYIYLCEGTFSLNDY